MARCTVPSILSIVALCASPGGARAQGRWQLSVEAPAAVPVSEPQRQWFSTGSLPSAAVHLSVTRHVMVGARLRAGVLGAGRATDPSLMDKEAGGLASLVAAVRLRPLPGSPARRGTGAWLELAAGAAVTGQDLRPVIEVGAGWGFAAGRLGIGPSMRYLHLVQPDDRLSPADAGIILVGIEISVRARRRQPLPPPEIAAPAKPRPRPASPPSPPPLSIDSDGDRIVDEDDACPDRPETANGVDDADGCPDIGLFEVIEDRIALDQRVLFDTNRARVKRRGRRVLAAIAAYLADHDELERIEIEGHADARGPDDYNIRLSQMRAERVGRVLTRLGVAAPIAVAGRGEAQPRVPGRGERAWQANRRVELFLVRRVPVPAMTPEATP